MRSRPSFSNVSNELWKSPWRPSHRPLPEPDTPSSAVSLVEHPGVPGGRESGGPPLRAGLSKEPGRQSS